MGENEILCRGVYKNHLQGQGLRRDHWLRKKDLAQGQLSVWRAKHIGDPDAVAALLAPRGRKALVRVVAATANDLRSLRFGPNQERALCVVDDTTDGDDSRHPAHAALAACQEHDFGDLEGDEFTQIFEAILNLYEDNVIWPARHEPNDA